METGGYCTSKIRVLDHDDVKGARILVSSAHLLKVKYKSFDDEIDNELGPSTLRLAHAFISVEVS